MQKCPQKDHRFTHFPYQVVVTGLTFYMTQNSAHTLQRSVNKILTDCYYVTAGSLEASWISLTLLGHHMCHRVNTVYIFSSCFNLLNSSLYTQLTSRKQEPHT